METLLNALRAAGESTRLRLLGLLARYDLTVSELTQILGQSQPRLSRHLKVLVEAGLVERHQEGALAFFRLAQHGPAAEFARDLCARIPPADPVFQRDRRRLEDVRKLRSEAAAAYFSANAAEWVRIRSLYVDESQIEHAMLEAASNPEIDNLLDIGTGTGRILQVFGARVKHGLGIDLSRDMLAVARANLEESGLNHCKVQQGDIYSLILPAGSMDVVTIHQVLHFLDDPASAIAEAAKTLRPGGELIAVDFAPHSLEYLRKEFAHRRLGFDDAEVQHWCEAAGLEGVTAIHLEPTGPVADKQLSVTLWKARQLRAAPSNHRLEVA